MPFLRCTPEGETVSVLPCSLRYQHIDINNSGGISRDIDIFTIDFEAAAFVKLCTIAGQGELVFLLQGSMLVVQHRDGDKSLLDIRNPTAPHVKLRHKTVKSQSAFRCSILTDHMYRADRTTPCSAPTSHIRHCRVHKVNRDIPGTANSLSGLNGHRSGTTNPS